MVWEVVSDGVAPEKQQPNTGRGSWEIVGDSEASEEDQVAAYVQAYNRINPHKPITAADVPNRKGIIGAGKELGYGILDATRDQFPEDVARTVQGGDVPARPDESFSERTLQEQGRDAAGRVMSRQVVTGDKLHESLYQGPKSVATSAAAGLSAGAAGTAVGAGAGSVFPGPGTAAGGTIGGIVGAGAGTGAVFYRMAKNQFLHMIRDKALAANAEISEEDWQKIRADVESSATEYGLWEAGPEALSQAFTAGLFKGVGGKVFGAIPGFKGITDKIAKNAVARVTAKYAAEVGEEEATEFVTFLGQGKIEQEHGLRDTAPGLDEFVSTQAGPVAVGSLVQGGAYHVVERLGARKSVAPGEHKDLLEDEPPAEARPISDTPAAPVAGEDGYSEAEVNRRYTEEHAARFPSARDLLAQDEPKLRGYEEPARGFGIAPTEYLDAPGYSEDEVRRGYEEIHAARFPDVREVAGRGLDSFVKSALPMFSERVQAQPFTREELAATAPERQQATGDAGTWELVSEENPVPEIQPQAEAKTKAGTSLERPGAMLRKDGKPFPTKRAAESQAGVLRRAGLAADVVSLPGGGFGIETGAQPGQAGPQKQPWQMTKQEFLEANVNKKNVVPHENRVFQAVVRGDPVPERVLREYEGRQWANAVLGIGGANIKDGLSLYSDADIKASNKRSNDELRGEGRKVAHIVRRTLDKGRMIYEAYDDAGKLIAKKTGNPSKGKTIEVMATDRGYYPGDNHSRSSVSSDWKYSLEHFEGKSGILETLPQPGVTVIKRSEAPYVQQADAAPRLHAGGLPQAPQVPQGVQPSPEGLDRAPAGAGQVQEGDARRAADLIYSRADNDASAVFGPPTLEELHATALGMVGSGEITEIQAVAAVDLLAADLASDMETLAERAESGDLTEREETVLRAFVEEEQGEDWPPLVLAAWGSLAGEKVKETHEEGFRELVRKYGPGFFGGGSASDDLAAQLASGRVFFGEGGEELIEALLQAEPPGYVVRGEPRPKHLPKLRSSRQDFRRPDGSFPSLGAATAWARQKGFKNVTVRETENGYEVSLTGEEAGAAAAPGDGYAGVADQVKASLEEGRKVAWKDLQAWANEAFGGTQAEGKWNAKDAYDSMEMGVNEFLRDQGFNPGTADAEGVKAAVQEIQQVMDLLPTQTRRTEEQMEFQQFSTPPSLAAVAAWAGKPSERDVVLEPSAGVGGLAVFAANAGAEVHTNELDQRRRALLEHQGYAVTGENAEQLHNILPEDMRPTLVLMNPPFSSTAGRKKGERSTKNATLHLDQALERLEPGGRLVAILSQGMSADKAHMGSWWRKTRKKYALRANIKLDGSIYKKYGTAYDNLMIVIDKVPPSDDTFINVECKTLGEAIRALDEVRDVRVDPAEHPSFEPAGEVRPGGGERPGRPDRTVRGAAGELGDLDRQGEGQGHPAGGVRGRSERAPAGDGHGRAGRDSGGADEAGAASRVPGGGDRESGVLAPDRGGPAVPESGEPGLPQALEVETAQREHEPAGELTDSLFESYRPQRVSIPGAKPHPSPLVQSAAMAAVEPPAPSYRPHLPRSVVESGALSEAQIEQVLYAGQAHSETLPDGSRRGYFIGDGTGVGKGREIAGVLLDNWNQGRRKQVWITFNSSLFEDARRDVKGIGDDPGKVFRLSDFRLGEPIERAEGILFTTYATLPQKAKADSENGASRLAQIAAWLGEDFDGVIVFDEAHKMGNAIEIQVEGGRGARQPAQQAVAGVELQQLMPGARVLYVSATGASEPSNLSYAERLGLWGERTPFPSKISFIAAVESGGVAAMELVSRDLKGMGSYLARTLSYEGVTYSRLEHGLTEHQLKAYDIYARSWQTVLQNIHEAMDMTAQDKNRQARSAALSLFWGNHQRFFGQVLTSMTMPSVLKDIRAELDAGRSCVIQLVNTNEAAQERELQRAAATGEDLAGLDITPRQMLMEYVRRAFPTHQYEEYKDDDGNTRSRLVRDSKGSPVQNRAAVKMRDGLLEKLDLLKVPGNPLDMIVEEFGPNMVAEITGRKRRVVLGEEQRRGPAAATKEAEEFMAGKRRVLVFSQAGGTGRSYHADRAAKNQQKRIHYILQAGWRADAATQGLGRTNRSNQAETPHYKLVTTDLRGHKRFTSSIARRLDQLGALTQGQRQTGSQGLFTASDNLENPQAHDAWAWLCGDIYKGKVEGVSYDEFQEQTGLELARKDETGNMRLEVPPIRQFLNRLLSMTVDFQNKVFTAFETRLADVQRTAEERGEVDKGVETLQAERIEMVREEVLYKDQRTGAETKALELKIHKRRDLMSHARLLQEHGEPASGWWRNKISGRVYAGYPGGVHQDEAGRLEERTLLRGINAGKPRRVEVDALHESYEQVDTKTAAEAWDKAMDGAEKTVETHGWLITGMLLPVWDRISGQANVYRLQDTEGRRHLGRLLSRDEYNQTRDNLGLDREVPQYTPAEALAAVRKGRKLTLSGGYVLEPRRVSNEVRVELSGEAVALELENLKKHGAFTEIIAYRPRVFVPVGDKGVSFLERMLAQHPLIDERSAKDFLGGGVVHFSASPEGRSREGMSANTVRGALQDLQARAKNALPLRVVQSFEDLPRRIKRQAREQGVANVEAAFDEQTRTVYLVADALPSRKRAVQAWLHEQGLHRGLRGLLGGDRRFRQFLRGVYESAGGRKAFREIAADYNLDLSNSAHQLQAAEEYLAKLAEKVRLDQDLTATETRVWRRFVRFMKELLAALGARVQFSDQEISDMVRASVLWTLEGQEAAKDPSLAHDMGEWARQVTERAAGKLHPRHELVLGRTADVYRRLGMKDLPMVLTPGKADKVEADHGLSLKDLERLPALLDAPLAVLDSATLAGTYVAVVDMTDAQGRQIRVAIHPDAQVRGRLVNKVASVYGQQDIKGWLTAQVQAGRLRYFDKKKGSPRLGVLARLQLPGTTKAGTADVRKAILTEKDIVKRDPDVRFSIPSRGQSSALDAALDKIGSPRTTMGERFRALRDRLRAEAEQGLFDRFASLRTVDEAAGVARAEDSAYIAARMTTSLGDQMAALLEHGAPIWRDGAVDVDSVGHGLAKVFEPVNGELDRWCAWMVGKRAAKLAAEGRENLFSAEEIAALQGLNAGREAAYDRVWRDYVRFKTKVLDFAQEAGVIDPDGRTVWEHDEYIPFYRVTEEGGITGPANKRGIASQRSGIKTLKGGTSNLGDPFENIIRNFSHLVDASVKNHAMDLAMRNAEACGAAHEAGLKWEAVRLPAGAMQAALRKVFGDKDAVWPMSEAQRRSIQAVFRLVRPTGEDMVHVLRDGKPVYYQVGDPLLLRALTAVNQKAWNNVAIRTARWFKRVLTRGVTATPPFMVRNLARDTLSAWVVDGKNSFKPVLGSLRGLVKTLRQDEDTVHMLAAGASFQGGYAYGHDPAAAKLHVERIMRRHKVKESSVLDTPRKLGRFLRKGWERWEEMGSAVENATRAEIYAARRRKGKSHLEAAYEAKNIMDYSMRGDWPLVRLLCEVVPFLGARMTGLHRMGKGYLENPRAFLTKGALITLASVLLYLRHKDDEEYKALEDWDRDTYYHFWIDGEHYRLPKPFEVGAIFGTLAERITEQFVNDEADGAVFAERLAWMLQQMFSVDVPQVAAPILEQWANKDFFTGRPIVERSLERLRPGDQRRPWTSATASEVARALDESGLPLPLAVRSPKRLEHLIGAYFGSMGLFVLSGADVVTQWLFDYPADPELRTGDLPVVSSFYREGPERHPRQLGDLYELIHDVQGLALTVNELRQTGDPERARQTVEQNRGALRLKSLSYKMERRLADLNRAMRMVHADRNMTPEEKRQKLDELVLKRNALVRRALERMKDKASH